MTATLWTDSDRDEGLSLGGTLQLYEAFSEMARVSGESWGSDYPDLSGVVSQVEDGDDADPDWLDAVQDQASRFKANHGKEVSGYTAGLLDLLAARPGKLGDSPIAARRSIEPPRMRE